MNNIVKPETVRNVSLLLKQKRPQIEIIGGVVGTGIAMFLSNKSSTKLPKILKEMKEDLEAANKKYAGDRLKKEKAKIRQKAFVTFAKLYGPSTAFYLLSIAGILDGMNVQNNKLIGMSTGLAILTKEFDEYRKMNSEKIGVEAESNLYNRMKTETIETTSINPKNGEEKKTKTNVKKFNDVGFNHGLFSFKFGKGYSTFYNNNDNPDYAINFLKERENHINEVIVQKEGSITTRDILHRIGITDEMILNQPGKPNNNKPFLAMLNNSGYIYDPDKPFSFGITDDVVQALRRGEDVYLTMNIDPDIVTGIYQKIYGGNDND